MVVTTKKSEALRVCLDPQDLHKAIVAMGTAGAQLFSKLDAKEGFWQCKLDDASSRLTCFNTPFGLYCYRRLPYTVKCAPEQFQRKMCKFLLAWMV